MTEALSTALTEDQLGPLGDKLGSGAQANVFDLPELTLPDLDGALVYKRYKKGLAPQHGMGTIIAMRDRLRHDPTKLAKLDAMTTWPLRQVVDVEGALLGVVLQRIPDSFMHDLQLPSGAVKRAIREVQFLFIPADRALRGGTALPSLVERLTVCRDFAATLAFLHRELNVAFGDINARNAVFRVGADPTVMFVDCDAVRRVGEVAGAPQLNAPDWEPPEGSAVLSRQTDLYKLGLFVLRCLTPGHESSINRDPSRAQGILDPHGLSLLRQAVADAPDWRPSAEEWYRYFRRVLGEALAPPRLDKAEVDRTIVAVGEPLTLTWAAEETDTIEVTGIGIPDTVVAGLTGSGTITLQPTRSGPITIAARNKLSVVTERLGPIAVYDLPAFRDLPVPMPHLAVPDLAPVELPPVGRVLPKFPERETASPMAYGIGAWFNPGDPDAERVGLGGPPPVFGSGPSFVPFDLTEIVPDPGTGGTQS